MKSQPMIDVEKEIKWDSIWRKHIEWMMNRSYKKQEKAWLQAVLDTMWDKISKEQFQEIMWSEITKLKSTFTDSYAYYNKLYRGLGDSQLQCNDILLHCKWIIKWI